MLMWERAERLATNNEKFIYVIGQQNILGAPINLDLTSDFCGPSDIEIQLV